MPGDVRAMTANLQAPLVINPATRLGKQVILTDERFSLRHPVFGPAEVRPGHGREVRPGDVRHGEARHGGSKHAATRRAF